MTMYRGRMRGTKKNRFNLLGGGDVEAGETDSPATERAEGEGKGFPSERHTHVAQQRKGHGRDVRAAESRQGTNPTNKKMGRADDVDAPVKGDGSPHFKR